MDLAAHMGWGNKKLRVWLRDAWRAGHPLLSSHRLNDLWVFTPEEADQLHREATRGPWVRKTFEGYL